MDRIGLYLNAMSGKRLLALDDAIGKNFEDVKSFGAQQSKTEPIPDILIQIALEGDDGALWTGLRRFYLKDIVDKAFDPGDAAYMPKQPTMLSEAALTDFLNTLLSGEPDAERAVLVLGGHADGAGVVLDDFPALKQLYASSAALVPTIHEDIADVTPHWLSSQEFVNAMKTIPRDHDQKRLGIIAFDACENASLEIATEVAPYAHYLVASETGSPSEGWDYADWPSSVVGAKPDAGAAAMGMVKSYATRNSSPLQPRASLTGLKLDAVDEVCAAVRALSDMVLVDDTKLSQLAKVRELFVPLPEREFFRVDVGFFFEKLGSTQGIDSGLRDAANKIVKAVQALVDGRFWSTENAGVSGVSVVFPGRKLEFLSSWKDVYMDRQYFPRFKDKTRWHEVLVALYVKSRES